MKDWKRISVEVPRKTYEEFYRMFPNRGQRSTVLRRLLTAIVKMKGKKNCFEEEVLDYLGGD